jgi:hypothetical protein
MVQTMFQGVVRLVRGGGMLSGALVLGGVLGSAWGCGARADDAMAAVGSGHADSSADGHATSSAPPTPTAGQAPPLPQGTGESLPEQPIGMPTELSSGPDGRPGCWLNQELVCEALGSSAAEHCECRTIVPRNAADCALPEQFVCSDAGAECYCDDEAGCPPGTRPSCDSYAPQLGCGCFAIYTR